MNMFIKPKTRNIPVRIITDYRPQFQAIRVKTLGKEEEWVVKPEEVFSQDQIDAERKQKEDEKTISRNKLLLSVWESGVHDMSQLAEACGIPVVAVWMKLKALKRRNIIACE